MQLEAGLSDEAVLHELGARLGQLRLDRNLSQQQLADEAGISRHTLMRLEAGHSVTLSALVRVLRALDLLQGLETLVPQPLPSPLQQLEHQSGRRQRASGSRRKRTDPQRDDWRWGTP